MSFAVNKGLKVEGVDVWTPERHLAEGYLQPHERSAWIRAYSSKSSWPWIETVQVSQAKLGLWT
jgi:hypothetical protein